MRKKERPPPDPRSIAIRFHLLGAYMDIITILRSWIPTGIELQVGSIVSAVGTVAAYFIGWDDAMEVLLVLMILDYITGLLAAYINPNLQLNSNRGFKGICKKIMILLLIVLAHELEKATGIPTIQSVVVWFFIGNEGLSIIENAAKSGVPIPAKLRNTLEQLQSEKEAERK